MDGRLIGNYRLKRELGRGAFGVAFQADEEFEGQTFGLPVAVKLIEPQNAAHRASIIHELNALSRASHPHIVGYRNFGLTTQDGQELIYIVLEFAESGTLTDVLRKSQMTPRALLEVARDVAQGLAFLANQGMTHRDIKPDNLLAFKGAIGAPVWKISDLGLAAPVALDGRATSIAGTRLYMAPEAWQGARSPALDVWALGLCLHEAATQRRMWDGAAPGAIEHLICGDALPIEPDLPLVLRPLIEGCLEKNPSRRWSASQAHGYALKALEDLPSEIDNPIIVSQGGGGTHSNLRDAVAAALPNSRIVILPGRYIEPILLDKNLHLLGHDLKGREARDKIILECGTGNTLKVMGAQCRVENLTLRGVARGQNKKFHAVSVSNGSLGLKNCVVTSDSLACVMAGSSARVALLDCRVEAGATDGVLATDGAQVVLRAGSIESCSRAGISVKNQARVDARALKIAECHEAGVRVSDGASIILDGCNLTGNEAGLTVSAGAQATVKGGHIAHNTRQGVRAESGSQATIENCDLKGNGFGAWQIDAGANVTRHNNTPA